MAQVKAIDGERVDGKFVGDDGTTPEQGQEEVQQILDRCYAMADEALKRWVYCVHKPDG